MDELLEQIKKLSREEQLTLANQIYAWEPEVSALSESEEQILVARAKAAKRNGFPGRPADDVLADLEQAITKNIIAA